LSLHVLKVPLSRVDLRNTTNFSLFTHFL
jgi:hypothetical protein